MHRAHSSGTLWGGRLSRWSPSRHTPCCGRKASRADSQRAIAILCAEDNLAHFYARRAATCDGLRRVVELSFERSEEEEERGRGGEGRGGERVHRRGSTSIERHARALILLFFKKTRLTPRSGASEGERLRPRPRRKSEFRMEWTGRIRVRLSVRVTCHVRSRAAFFLRNDGRETRREARREQDGVRRATFVKCLVREKYRSLHCRRYSREARASKETERLRFSRRGLVGGCRRVVADPADRVIAWQHYQAESTSRKNYAADSIARTSRAPWPNPRASRLNARKSPIPRLGDKGDRPCDEEK